MYIYIPFQWFLLFLVSRRYMHLSSDMIWAISEFDYISTGTCFTPATWFILYRRMTIFLFSAGTRVTPAIPCRLYWSLYSRWSTTVWTVLHHKRGVVKTRNQGPQEMAYVLINIEWLPGSPVKEHYLLKDCVCPDFHNIYLWICGFLGHQQHIWRDYDLPGFPEFMHVPCIEGLWHQVPLVLNY